MLYANVSERYKSLNPLSGAYGRTCAWHL